MTLFTYASYINPRYMTSDSSAILVTLGGVMVNGNYLGTVLFVASPKDIEKHGKDLYAHIIANAAIIPIADYVPLPARTPKEKAVVAGDEGDSSPSTATTTP